MTRTLRQAGWTPLVLTLLLLVGCTSGSGLVGVPSPGPGAPTGPPLPSSDAGLADHVPQQIVIGVLPNTDAHRIAASIGGVVIREIRELHSITLRFPQPISIVDTIRKIQGIAGVKYAEPNYVYQPFLPPNDPFFASKQWGPQKINAPSAWDITTGSPNAVVAVLDTGVDGTHPEFSGKMLTGTNCTAEPGTPLAHGTHVAGIAAAIGNNGAGIAGISWNAGILPVKVCTTSGCTNTDIACGVAFVTTFATTTPGVKVVENVSLGGPGYAQQLKDAFDNAVQNGVLVVASSGNDGKSTVLFPAGYPGVMAVGASTPTNDRAVFSTYGSHLSVIAPGVDIYSTIPGGGYSLMSGTSMAAPHVAGVAALIRAGNPTLTPSQVRAQIEQTATHLGSPGFNPQFGWGLVNAAAVVGSPVTSNYGQIQVTVLDNVTLVPVGAADVIVWVGTTSCLGLTQVVQTAQTNSSGVAVFGAVSAGSYCATASTTAKKATTQTPFLVTAGATTNATLVIAP